MIKKLVAFKSSWRKITPYVFLLVNIVLFTGFTTYAQSSKAVPTNKSTLQTTRVEEFQIRGTEPFWNVDLTKRGIFISTPDTKKLTFAYIAPLTAMGRTTDTVRVYKLRGDNTLIIEKANACSDGMSEREYPYSATFILGNKLLQGCAEKKSD